jgi:hypothetical protein
MAQSGNFQPLSRDSPHETKEDCHDEESDRKPAVCVHEEPDSQGSEDQSCNDSRPSQEIKQRKVRTRQGIMSSRGWELIFAHVLLRAALDSIKSVISRSIVPWFD